MHKTASGTVNLTNACARWWILKDEPALGGNSGHLAGRESYGRSSTSDPVVRMFSILYISASTVGNTEHYEFSIFKTIAFARQADLKKTRY